MGELAAQWKAPQAHLRKKRGYFPRRAVLVLTYPGTSRLLTFGRSGSKSLQKALVAERPNRGRPDKRAATCLNAAVANCQLRQTSGSYRAHLL